MLGKIVSVLRDTGSDTMIVRRSLVPDEALTRTTTTLLFADGSEITVPEAVVEIFSPYFSGVCIVKCMRSPLRDIIMGNVPGLRQAHDPDSTWEEKLAAVKFKSDSPARVKYKKGQHRKPFLSVIKSASFQPNSATHKVDTENDERGAESCAS